MERKKRSFVSPGEGLTPPPQTPNEIPKSRGGKLSEDAAKLRLVLNAIKHPIDLVINFYFTSSDL